MEPFFCQSDRWPLVPGRVSDAYPKNDHYSPCNFRKGEDILEKILVTAIRSQKVRTGAADLSHLALVTGLGPLGPAQSRLGYGRSFGHRVASAASAREFSFVCMKDGRREVSGVRSRSGVL